MAWDEPTLKRTLLIQRVGIPSNVTYRLHPLMRVTTNEGETYMEPIPTGDVSLPHMGFVFAAVEFIDEPGSAVGNQGDTWIHRETNQANLQLTG